MSRIKRRQFLQFAGSTLVTLGLSQLDLLRASERYGRVLAQSTPRKLALLVGINNYLFDPLKGCVTDTFLQQHLLIHRFGFNPQDIVILTDEQATRQNILNRFEEHLIKQAKPGDVVVYHFSGHGSQVRDPDYPSCDFPGDCLNSTFVPVDSALPAGFPNQSGSVQDIMGRTLFLLMSAIQTENFTAVLDSCYSGGGTRGNMKVRSRNGGSKLQPIEDEQAYQQQWLSKLGISPTEFKQRRLEGIAKGVVIASARRDQEAIDSPFNGFSAGAFTYLMTQYLWQQTGSEPFSRVIPNVARSTLRLTSDKQEPLIEYKPGSDYPKSPTYFLNEPTPAAEAVITKVQGNQAELWLGGLDPDSLTAFDRGAILSVVDLQGREQGRVQLEARTGLVGQAKLLDAAQVGAFLQERSRSIPNNLTLKIGLDPSLGNEANQAKQALASIPRLEALPLQQQEVQYIFGRMTNVYQQQLQVPAGSKLPDAGSLGLFSPALEMIPDSFGATSETITSAITRLRPKFQSLLAARIVKTALNTNSSRLNVVASMQPEGREARPATVFPIRGVGVGTPTDQPTPVISSNSQQLPLGTPVQIQVKNNETSELYLSVLVIDPTGEISVIFPNQWVAAEEVTLVAAGSTLKIPDPTKDSFRIVAQEPKGVAEVLILASRTPLRQALQALRELAARDNKRTGVVNLRGTQQQNEPAKVMDYLLDDINNGNQGTSSSTIRNIDTSQLAALSITFEVI